MNAGGKDVNVIIPLNKYSFFEELEGKILPPMWLQFNKELDDDDELIHRANASANGRVVVDGFLLRIPKLTPKDSMYDRFVSSFPKETQWTYMREMFEVSAPTTASGFFQISASTDNVKHIFVYLKKGYRNANGSRHFETTPYKMDTFSLDGASLSNCR